MGKTMGIQQGMLFGALSIQHGSLGRVLAAQTSGVEQKCEISPFCLVQVEVRGIVRVAV